MPQQYAPQFDMSAFGGSGPNSRFGSAAPFSTFNQRTVRNGQSGMGDYNVHPMLPSTGGGPMPMQQGPMGTTADDRSAGAANWFAQHDSPQAGVMGMQRPNGEMFAQGFPKPANGKGPGWAYMPAGQVAGLYNRMGQQFPGLGLDPLNVGEDGAVTGAGGGAIDDAGMARLMLQARTAAGQSKQQTMRDSMRRRLAVRSAQRGNLGPIMAANGGNWFAPPGLAAAITPRWGAGPFAPGMPGGMGGNAMAFPGEQGGVGGGGQPAMMMGMLKQTLDDVGGQLHPAVAAGLRLKVARALASPNGHLQIPNLINEIGKAGTGAAFKSEQLKAIRQREEANKNRVGRQSLGGAFMDAAPDVANTFRGFVPDFSGWFGGK